MLELEFFCVFVRMLLLVLKLLLCLQNQGEKIITFRDLLGKIPWGYSPSEKRSQES